MAGQNQTQNMDLFDAYFRRADLNQDGRISGEEAVAFFQGSNLPKQVLAQIWMHADQNRTGFLGRAEFYNALKLVTVAQSKRELTPDIVKSALYGPASAKIPVPQINLTAMAPSQSNPMSGTHVPQLNSVTPTASQNAGTKGPQVSASASIGQQSFLSQQNQFMKQPGPMPSGTTFRPQQGVASQGMPLGGSVAASHPLSSNISSDWLGGGTGGTPAGVTSQVPNRGISSSTTQDGFGLAASGLTPATQLRPQAITGLTQAAAPEPHDPNLLSYQGGAKDYKASVVSGNGFASDSVFGDVFSATSSQLKQDFQVPTSSTGSLPVSSAIASSSGSQPTAKPTPVGSLQSSFTQQPMANQYQRVQSTVKQNQQVSAPSFTAYTSTGLPVGAVNSATGQSQHSWPRMTQTDVQKYTKVFVDVDRDRDGKITGEQAHNLFLSWRLPREFLKQVWVLADQDNDGMLSLGEFCIALYLIERSREGRPLPTVLPSGIMFDESLLPATGQHAPAHGKAIWGSSPGLQQPKGMPGARPVTPAAGVRPPSKVSVSQADAGPRQRKLRVPVLEKQLADQLSKEEQDSLNSKFQEATEADKKVDELEKEILDSKEKIEICRTKMQELILYKSRCDNRLNEISARVSVDKHEVELLGKKYEEKYKQVGDVASKLTIEEATFRDIQAKKMELYQAIVKMEQGGGGDDIQSSADQIQSDLEELVKSLNDRCKNYGLRAKPTALVELPFGWQPGIQGGAADWNEDWDKFEHEGFTFVKELTLDVQNVIAPPKPKSSSVHIKSSSTVEGVTAVPSSDADDKSEKLPSPRKRIPEDELTDSQSEDGISRTPPDSPAERNALESPSKKYQDSQSTKNIGADGSPHYDSPHGVDTQSEHDGAESLLSGDKNFDEPSWGTFDTNYDTDSVWDFNPVTTKDMDHEKHNESSFFNSDGWGLNPIRTHSSHTDSIFKKKSTSSFADSVPSTPIFSSGNSPHTNNMFQKKSPFAFDDSVPSTPMFNSVNSPRRFSGGPEEHSFDNFSRFDSFNTSDSGFFAPRESLTRFDSIQSTRDSDYGHGFFPPPDSVTRFDSFRSTRDSDSNYGLFPAPDSLTRFDSIRSTRDANYSHAFPSFDDTDPFGSSGPFKTSQESQTPRRDSDSWRAF